MTIRGRTVRDLGIPEPEAVAYKWRLVSELKNAMEAEGLEPAAIASAAGETSPEIVEGMLRGRVRDIDTYEIMRIMSSIGYRFWIDILPPEAGEAGAIWAD